MKRVLAFTPRASGDIEDAYRWYEAEQPGLGAEFRDELWRVLELVVTAPEMAPMVHRDLRRVLTKRFPYALYYRVADGAIEVRACLHQRRHQRVGSRRA